MSSEILGLQQILGADEIDELLGEADDEELLGAAHRRQATRRALPMSAQRNAVAVQDRPPTKGRELVVGFDSGAGTIAAAAAANVNSNPQQVMRPERICVQGTAAVNFLINSLTIGTSIQFLNAVGVHAEIFSSLAQDVRLRMDTAQINSVISFNVTNISLAISRFFAALIGPAVM